MTESEILAKYRRFATVEYDSGHWYYYDDDARAWFEIPELKHEVQKQIVSPSGEKGSESLSALPDARLANSSPDGGGVGGSRRKCKNARRCR